MFLSFGLSFVADFLVFLLVRMLAQSHVRCRTRLRFSKLFGHESVFLCWRVCHPLCRFQLLISNSIRHAQHYHAARGPLREQCARRDALFPPPWRRRNRVPECKILQSVWQNFAVLVAHDKDRAMRMAEDLFRNAADEKPIYSTATLAAHYYQIRFGFRSRLNYNRVSRTFEHLVSDGNVASHPPPAQSCQLSFRVCKRLCPQRAESRRIEFS